MLYYMNCDTGKVIAREVDDEPYGDSWLEISEEEFYEHCPWMRPAVDQAEEEKVTTYLPPLKRTNYGRTY